MQSTKGPWIIGYGGQEGDTYAVITSPHAEYPIANLEPQGYSAANARLIAQAPALAETLARVVEDYMHLVAFIEHNTVDCQEKRARLMLAGAALEDAERVLGKIGGAK